MFVYLVFFLKFVIAMNEEDVSLMTTCEQNLQGKDCKCIHKSYRFVNLIHVLCIRISIFGHLFMLFKV